MELSERQTEFTDLGIQIAVMTYEPPETHLDFTKQYAIGYPILSDPDVQHVKAFGILNKSFEPGHRAHGVPHPGIFLVDGDGIIKAKFAEEGFRIRPAIDLVIEAAREMAMSRGGTAQ